jgi:hypothetical protein
MKDLTDTTPALTRSGAKCVRSYSASMYMSSLSTRLVDPWAFGAFGVAGFLPLGVVTTGGGSRAASSALSSAPPGAVRLVAGLRPPAHLRNTLMIFKFLIVFALDT